MKAKNYLLVIIIAISIGFFSLSSCMRKLNTCKCYFLNGDKFYYDMRGIGEMADSCRVLDHEAEMHEGNCFLR